MHKPDYDKMKFEITIIVHENAQTFSVKSLDGAPVSYQSLIGALDTVKMSYFFEQTGVNIEEYRKYIAKQKAKKTKTK